MPDDVYRALMDVTNFVDGAARVDHALKQIQQDLKEVTSTEIEFNKRGNATAATLTGISQAGDQVSVSIEKIGNSFKTTSSKITNANTSLNATQGLLQNVLNQLNTNNTNLANAVQGVANAQRQVAIQQAAIANATNQATTSSGGFLLSWQSITRFFEARVLYNSITQITNAVSNGVKESISFGEKVAQIQTLTPVGVFNDWDAAIKRVSNSLGTDALDTAKGFYNALSNQIGDNVSQIEAFTKTTAQFARTTASSAEEANSLFSAAINSFKLNTADADVIAAKFFKTIDLGRVTASGLSSNFGRVAAAAGAVGVTLDETLAALALLSKQGVTDSDAMTQLLNVFNKLLKPTDAFKKVLADVGFSSGQSLIQVRGLTGTIALLNDELEKGGASAVAAELGDLRAIRGGLSLTGKGFQDYKTILDQITNSQESYNRAIKITQETTSFKLQKQIEEVKNAFLSLGQTISEVAVTASAPFGGLLGVIKDLVILLTGAATAAVVVWASRSVSAITSIGSALSALRVVLASINPVAAIAALVGAGAAFLALSESVAQRQQRVYGETLDIVSQANKAIFASLDRVAAASTQRVNGFFRPLLENIAATRVGLNKTFEQLTDITQAFDKRIKRIAEADFQSIDDNLSAIRDKISELKSLENRALAELATDTRKAAIVSFDESIENLPVFQRVKAIQAHIDDLINTAKTEAQAGKGADALDTIKLIRAEQAKLIAEDKAGNRELTSLQKQQLDLKEAKNLADREQLDLQKQIQTITNQNSLQAKVVGTGKNRRIVSPNQNKIDLVDDKALLQGSRAQEQLDSLNAKSAQLAEKQKEINQLLNDKNGIETLHTVGDEDERIAKIAQQIADIAHQARLDAKNDEDAVKEKRIQLEAQYDTLKQIAGISKDNPIINNKTITTAAEGLDAINAAFANLEAARKAAGVNTQGGDILGDIQLKAILQARVNIAFQQKAAAELASADEKRQKDLNESIKANADVSKNAITARTELQAQLAALAAALPTEALNKGALSGNIISGVSDADEKLNSIVRKIKEVSDLAATTPEAAKQSLQQIQELVAQVDAIVAANDNTFTSAGTQTLSLIDNIKFELFKISQANDVITASQNAQNVSLQQTVQLEAQRAAFAEQAARAQQAAQQAINAVPQDIIHKSVGGSIGRGADRIPALLSPGEFVVNSGAARQFYSQLVSLNGPKGYSKGGSVTNVGDINVNLNSSGNTDVDVNKIGKLLRQQIRRGALSLK